MADRGVVWATVGEAEFLVPTCRLGAPQTGLVFQVGVGVTQFLDSVLVLRGQLLLGRAILCISLNEKNNLESSKYHLGSDLLKI